MSRCRLTFFLADSKKDLPRITHSSSGGKLGCVLSVYFLRSPSRAPYRTPSACAKRATYPDPAPVVPAAPRIHRCPGGLCRSSVARVGSRPEMFPGIEVLPHARESHVVNSETPVAPLDSRSRMSQRGRVTRVGSPCSPDFSNIMSCLRSPIAAGPQMTD